MIVSKFCNKFLPLRNGFEAKIEKTLQPQNFDLDLFSDPMSSPLYLIQFPLFQDNKDMGLDHLNYKHFLIQEYFHIPKVEPNLSKPKT